MKKFLKILVPFLTAAVLLLLFLRSRAVFVEIDPVVLTEQAFVTRWKVSLEDRSITLPLREGGEYDFTVNWGDGNQSQITSYDQPETTHTYERAGSYPMVITGKISGWAFQNKGDKGKITKIKQWGPLVFGSDGGYFYGCENLEITAEDSPDLVGTTTLRNAFRDCRSLTDVPGINDWDVSSVTDKSGMFRGALHFNGSIGEWDVSNVEDMSYMFSGTVNFTRPINNWDVSSVKDMEGMFSAVSDFTQVGNPRDKDNRRMSRLLTLPGAPSFNQPIGDWDVSSVENMSRMFFGSTLFNEPIGDWDVSNVKDMSEMFRHAINFNQPIGDWDVSRVEDMTAIFYMAASFNRPIDTWDVSNVESMRAAFLRTRSFNQSLEEWDVSSVKDMSWMFSWSAFNAPVSGWDVSNVQNMARMFSGASNFNQPIGNWNVSSVKNMSYMFYSSYSFDRSIGDWDVSNVRDMSSMFKRAETFNQPIGDWDVSRVKDMRDMFMGASSFDQPLNNWDVSGVENMDSMFSDATSFNQSIGDWDVSSVKTMHGMFRGAESFNQPIGDWDVSNVESMTGMFWGAASFNQSLDNWDMSNVRSKRSMFKGATSFEHEKPNGNGNNDADTRGARQRMRTQAEQKREHVVESNYEEKKYGIESYKEDIYRRLTKAESVGLEPEELHVLISRQQQKSELFTMILEVDREHGDITGEEYEELKGTVEEIDREVFDRLETMHGKETIRKATETVWDELQKQREAEARERAERESHLKSRVFHHYLQRISRAAGDALDSLRKQDITYGSFERTMAGLRKMLEDLKNHSGFEEPRYKVVVEQLQRVCEEALEYKKN